MGRAFFRNKGDFIMKCLSFIEIGNIMESTKAKKPINWETGEGVYWIGYRKEEATTIFPHLRFIQE